MKAALLYAVPSGHFDDGSSWGARAAGPAPHRSNAARGPERPVVAALLIALAVAILAGGCLAAARLGGPAGTAAAVAGLSGYVLVFARGLGELPFDWNSWRQRRLDEFVDLEDGELGDREEGGR